MSLRSFLKRRAQNQPAPPLDIHKRIRRLEIKTLRLVQNIFGGEYQSVFKGRGIEFDEVREYQEGDDPRLIDWNVTARMDRLFVKKFVEERELSVVLAVDLSASLFFGSQAQLKRELAAEVAAVVAMSAMRHHDRVGLLLFSDRIEKFIKPSKGRGHVNRLVREILAFRPRGRQTDLSGACNALMNLLKQRSVIFLLSDFQEPAIERSMRLLSTRHDLIPMMLHDVREAVLPNVGLVRFYDPESNETVTLDTASATVRTKYTNQHKQLRDAQLQCFRTLGLDFLELQTGQSFIPALVRFFTSRQTRRAKRRPG